MTYTNYKDPQTHKRQTIKSAVSQRYSDVFSDAVLTLRDIIQCEIEMNTGVDNIKTNRRNSKKISQVFPAMIDSEKFNEYLEMKIHFKQLLDGLLRVRSEFNK